MHEGHVVDALGQVRHESLIHLPHWPYCRQFQGLFMQAPGLRLEQLDLFAGIERLRRVA